MTLLAQGFKPRGAFQDSSQAFAGSGPGSCLLAEGHRDAGVHVVVLHYVIALEPGRGGLVAMAVGWLLQL